MWGPVEGHNSWPGKVVEVMDNSMVLVCWYGGRTVSQVYKHCICRKINTLICRLTDNAQEYIMLIIILYNNIHTKD